MKKLLLVFILFFSIVNLSADYLLNFGTSLVVRSQQTLQEIKDRPEKLKELLDNYDSVKIIVSDGNWINAIVLPLDPREGSVIRVVRDSNWNLRVVFKEVNTNFYKGDTYLFTFKNGKWIQTFGYAIN